VYQRRLRAHVFDVTLIADHWLSSSLAAICRQYWGLENRDTLCAENKTPQTSSKAVNGKEIFPIPSPADYGVQRNVVSGAQGAVLTENKFRASEHFYTNDSVASMRRKI